MEGVLLSSLEHVSVFDTASLYLRALWITISMVSFVAGTRVFRHMARLPFCLRRGPWYMMAYGFTGYGMAKLGWLFDSLETAETFWQPMSYLSAIMAGLGVAWTLEILMKHADPTKRHIDLT